MKPAELQDGEKRKKDPFGGFIGRSNAAAYNFLLLAAARRIWKEEFIELAVERMVNYTDENNELANKKKLEANKGHIKRIIEGHLPAKEAMVE